MKVRAAYYYDGSKIDREEKNLQSKYNKGDTVMLRPDKVTDPLKEFQISEVFFLNYTYDKFRYNGWVGRKYLPNVDESKLISGAEIQKANETLLKEIDEKIAELEKARKSLRKKAAQRVSVEEK